MKRTKICLNFMAGNEEHVVLQMLESCALHVDYWVAQCNGSDNTVDIVENFFKEKRIPGFSYYVDWQYPGYNSDHLMQTCLNANHNCDWFLRIDPDECLVVQNAFDWSVLEDTSIQSFDVMAKNDSVSWRRSRIWNSKLPWRFKHNKRHECIILPGYGESGEDFQRVTLDSNFYHYITNAGKSYYNPAKFALDALEIEADQLLNNTMTQDLYHTFYIAKSYFDAFTVGIFPFGMEHSVEFARRAIFYFLQYEKEMQKNSSTHEMLYYARFCLANSYLFCEMYKEAESAFLRCDLCQIPRNEHIFDLAKLYRFLNRYDEMLFQTHRLVDPHRKNPVPVFNFLVNSNVYIDTGRSGVDLHNEALRLNQRQ